MLKAYAQYDIVAVRAALQVRPNRNNVPGDKYMKSS